MDENTDYSQSRKAELAIVALRRRLLSLGVFVLMLMMLISGPLSLAHATMHHLSVSPSQGRLPVERNYAEASVSNPAVSPYLYQGDQPLSPEQAMLEQHCVICQWLQAAPLREAHPSACRVLADFAYAVPFDSQAAKFAPPPLQRPPRS